MRRVRLEFSDGYLGTMGYLNRMGFFDHLAKEIEVSPSCPEVSGAKAYRGNSAGVVEIARINPQLRECDLPGRLSNAVGNAFAKHSEVACRNFAFKMAGNLDRCRYYDSKQTP